MRRGEVWWANLPQPVGRRPVVLLSRDEAYAIRELVIATPITNRGRNITAEVRLGPEDGLPRSSVANLDTIITIPKNSLQTQITSLRREKLQAVEEALHFALGLEN